MPIGHIIIVSTLIAFFGLLKIFHPQFLVFLFSWFGKLPGDIEYDHGGTPISLPLMSIFCISLLIGFVSSLFM